MSDRYGISIGRILHPTDFSRGSDIAFAHALRIACATKGSLSVLHVDRDTEPPDWDQYPSVRGTLSRWKLLPATASRSDVSHLGIHITKSSMAHDDPARGILHHLDTHPADLLVLATHQRHGLDRWLHKTVAGAVNRRTDGATLFVPFGHSGFVSLETGECRLRRILLPIDTMPTPAPAIEVTADLVGYLGTELCEVSVLHVGESMGSTGVRWPASEKCKWHLVTRQGAVVSTILDEAERQSSDLIVMTTSGRHGFFDALRGSTTEQIVENACCPVLAIHAWED